MNDYITQAWDKRSKEFGKKREGVLPKSFPSTINQSLHNWMLNQVEGVIDRNKNFRILDLGCGYGRLSEDLLKEFPKIRTFGIDVAPTYVEIYNKSLSPRGRAIVGDISGLPFKSSFFDAAFIVTTLMYLIREEDQRKALKELFRVLKPNGKFVIIERNPTGQSIIMAGGLVSKIRGAKYREIESISFSSFYLSGLIEKCGGVVTRTSGLPAWTITLPVLILLSMIWKSGTKFLLRAIGAFDKRLSSCLTPSLYISYIGKKR